MKVVKDSEMDPAKINREEQISGWDNNYKYYGNDVIPSMKDPNIKPASPFSKCRSFLYPITQK
ncbi:hypothetical protein JCM15831A_14710 [Asaia astilbis]